MIHHILKDDDFGIIIYCNTVLIRKKLFYQLTKKKLLNQIKF